MKFHLSYLFLLGINFCSLKKNEFPHSKPITVQNSNPYTQNSSLHLNHHPDWNLFNQKTEFKLLVTSNFRKQIFPCGCSENPLGGLSRIYELFLSLDQLWAENQQSYLIMDSGNRSSMHAEGQDLEPLLSLERFLLNQFILKTMNAFTLSTWDLTSSNQPLVDMLQKSHLAKLDDDFQIINVEKGRRINPQLKLTDHENYQNPTFFMSNLVSKKETQKNPFFGSQYPFKALIINATTFNIIGLSFLSQNAILSYLQDSQKIEQYNLWQGFQEYFSIIPIESHYDQLIKKIISYNQEKQLPKKNYILIFTDLSESEMDHFYQKAVTKPDLVIFSGFQNIQNHQKPFQKVSLNSQGKEVLLVDFNPKGIATKAIQLDQFFKVNNPIFKEIDGEIEQFNQKNSLINKTQFQWNSIYEAKKCSECHQTQFNFWKQHPHYYSISSLFNSQLSYKNQYCLQCHSLPLQNQYVAFSKESVKDLSLMTQFIQKLNQNAVEEYHKHNKVTQQIELSEMLEKQSGFMGQVHCYHCHLENVKAINPTEKIPHSQMIKPTIKSCQNCHNGLNAPLADTSLFEKGKCPKH